MKKRAVVICPGRGSYTKESLGYLKRFGQKATEFITDLDVRRTQVHEPTITALDSAEVFQTNVHSKGEHASALIYACAHIDYQAINLDNYDIVAVTGNSMGWYLALAMTGSLDRAGAFTVINGMGSMMKEQIIGGQVIYPVVDDNWVISPTRLKLVEHILTGLKSQPGVEIYKSIDLGGYVVFGGNKNGITALLKALPPVENYPFQLIHHAAFHTPLLQATSERALAQMEVSLFHRPRIPLIDGRGFIWQPYSTNTAALHQYTLGQQVVEPYNFTRAISVAIKEFAPDQLILLGPGSSLGGSIGQILIENDWHGLKSKSQFSERQVRNPLLLAMGREDQREVVTR